jgi:FtsP/CotA-like multicopper oxidase with cupredoxin domain
MSTTVSRRALLGAALATGVVPAAARAASEAPKRLVAGTRMLEVNGRPARVFGLIGPDGRPGLRLAAGERFRVDLVNEAGEPTLIHWHGQLPPWTQDGFPWPQTPAIANGAVQAYDYAPIAGTYWMHSHHGMQEQNLMTAPLIVQDVATAREDRQDVVLILDDFNFRSPQQVLAGLTGTDAQAAHAMAQKADPGSEQAAGGDAAQPRMAGMAAHDMAGMAAPAGGMAEPQMGKPQMGKPERGKPEMAKPATTASGAGEMTMDLNDVDYDAFLANDRTLADPEIVRVDRGGRVRLRIINGASSSQFWIDIGTLTGRVVAVDGHDVRPVAASRFPMSMAQRLDILIDLPASGAFAVLARLEGSPRQTGIVLASAAAPIARIADAAQQAAPPVDNSLEMRLVATQSLPSRPADIVHTVILDGGMKPYAWSMNGEYWPKVTPLMLARGQRVEIDLVNRTMMSHPMHLHGHTFQVIAIDGKPVQGAVRDTVLVGPRGHIRIAFDADNPGRWAFHCHNLYHMQTGMLTEFRYRGIEA